MKLPAWKFDVQLSQANLIALAGVCILACVVLGGVIAGTNRVYFSSVLPVDDLKVAAASEKIDPNTASVASLRRLPGIGVTRARAIVEYCHYHGPDAFARPEDLTKIHGIGEGTVQKISPYLKTPADEE